MIPSFRIRPVRVLSALAFMAAGCLASAEAVAQLELERTKSAYDAAVANVGAVQARLRDRVLVAPFSGVLGFRQVSLEVVRS